eukprot:Pgem_evm1s18335
MFLNFDTENFCLQSKTKVLTQLKELFNGYQHVTPAAFLFIGNFTKEPYGAQSYFELKSKLMYLFPFLLFVFVLGPSG